MIICCIVGCILLFSIFPLYSIGCRKEFDDSNMDIFVYDLHLPKELPYYTLGISEWNDGLKGQTQNILIGETSTFSNENITNLRILNLSHSALYPQLENYYFVDGFGMMYPITSSDGMGSIIYMPTREETSSIEANKKIPLLYIVIDSSIDQLPSEDLRKSKNDLIKLGKTFYEVHIEFYSHQ